MRISVFPSQRLARHWTPVNRHQYDDPIRRPNIGFAAQPSNATHQPDEAEIAQQVGLILGSVIPISPNSQLSLGPGIAKSYGYVDTATHQVVIQPMDRWHHQIDDHAQPVAFAESLPPAPPHNKWTVGTVASGTLGQMVDQGLKWLDQQIHATLDVKDLSLLDCRSHKVYALTFKNPDDGLKPVFLVLPNLPSDNPGTKPQPHVLLNQTQFEQFLKSKKQIAGMTT